VLVGLNVTVSTCTFLLSAVLSLTVSWSSAPWTLVILKGCTPRTMILRSDCPPALTWPRVRVLGLTVNEDSISTVSGTRIRAIPGLLVWSQTSEYHLPTGQSGRMLAVTSYDLAPPEPVVGLSLVWM